MEEGKNQVDVLKDIFSVVHDSELARILGCTRQAVSGARFSGKITKKMFDVVAEKTGMPRQQLRKMLPEPERKRGDHGPARDDLWEELKASLRDNRVLIEQNQKLIEENRRLLEMLNGKRD